MRRRAVLAEVVRFEVRVDVYLGSCRKGEERGRQECLARLIEDMLDIGAHRLVMDSRDQRDPLDRITIRNALKKRAPDHEFVYEHMDSAGDPLLWLADIAAWCHGAGGDWARRIAPVIGSVTRLDWP
ncbi:hypothetical protein [Saccharothrix sp.]|uniref:hypothetical protein n=1 Tax=Saccharothrix sp. TaxID=1873460 RepID=UPI00281201F3|nr:hypothetical protein [Saccharothrix sp.]